MTTKTSQPVLPLLLSPSIPSSYSAELLRRMAVSLVRCSIICYTTLNLTPCRLKKYPRSEIVHMLFVCLFVSLLNAVQDHPLAPLSVIQIYQTCWQSVHKLQA